MRRGYLFTIRVNNDERRAIAELATRLSRSQSDAVRFVVTEATRQLAQAETIQLVEDPKPIEGGNCATA